MTRTDVAALDHTLQLTGKWLAQLVREGPFSTHQQGYPWLRAVLHSLRDRLTKVTHLASQLPMLVRGFYYEGWRPALAPNQEETRAEFFRSVSRSLDDGGGSNAEMERATKAVFAPLEDRLSEGQVRHILSQLPAELQGLWSAEPTPGQQTRRAFSGALRRATGPGADSRPGDAEGRTDLMVAAEGAGHLLWLRSRER